MTFDPESLTDEQGLFLLDVARASVEAAVRHEPEPRASIPGLTVDGASFVTVYVRERLNGCLGSLEARGALVEDVSHNAYRAAIADPRFSPLKLDDLHEVSLHVSVLSGLSRLEVSTFEDLAAMTRPHVDGLLISHGRHRGTFLPAVWTQLPETRDFLRHLWLKANLDPDLWPTGLEVYRYTTRQFES